MVTFEQHFKESVWKKEDIDIFLDSNKMTWAKFDPEVGYILGNFLPRDGIVVVIQFRLL